MNIIILMNSIINEINNMNIFEHENHWKFDIVPEISPYDCIKGYISGKKLSKLTRTQFDPSCYYKIIIYIDLNYVLHLILLKNKEKILFEIENEYDLTILNLNSLIKTYSFLNDFLDTDKLSCKL